MPQVNPQLQILNEGGSKLNKYPQYGIRKTGKKWSIVKADNNTEKIADAKKGYLQWFGSEEAAKNQINSQNSAFNGNVPNALSGLDEIGAVFDAFYHAITDGKLWRSVGWLVLGAILLFVGIRLWMGKSALPSLPSSLPLPV